MTVRLLEVAQQELDEAVVYYNGQAPGLGDAFLWHPLGENTRRCRLRRFPYGLIYHEDPEGILIVAVAHTHRRPDYWRGRVKSVSRPRRRPRA